MKTFSRIYTTLIFLILYAPIGVMILYSFNSGKSPAVFQGFSLKWYAELFSDAKTLSALSNTLILAVSASLIATVIGTMAAYGMYRMKNKRLKNAINTVTNIPMMNPDIVTGISMMLLFVFVGTLFHFTNNLSFGTILIAHVTFCIPYVILSVLPKFRQLDPHLTEAAMDLGCTPLQAFIKVEFPAVLPGIFTGALMSFTMSLDDFVISYFTTGNGFQTLPIMIYSMTKKRVTPDMYALSSIMFITILVLLLINNYMQGRGERQKAQKVMANRTRRIVVRSSVALAVAAALVFLVILPIANLKQDKFEYEVEYVETPLAGTTLNVYNWGEYIADGSEDYQDIVDLFEQKYGIEVNYTTYASNEDMYAMIKGGGASYDLIIPSDYMVGKLREEGLLEPIDMSKLKNYHYIDEKYKDNMFYDPQNEYSVPYTVGMIGVIYNTTMVDPADVEMKSWDLMWNTDYAGDILTFDNPRDAFGIAQILLGQNVNSTERDDWLIARDKLLEQRKILQGYMMDEIFQTMEGGNAAIAAYYAGDCLSMIAENPDLAFYYPEEGTNVFVDAMCIPKGAKNVDAAMLFIDFLLEPDIAALNANYICYASPHTAVPTNEYYDYPEGTPEYDILYNTPESYITDPSKTQYYHTMSSDMIEFYSNLFFAVKASKS